MLATTLLTLLAIAVVGWRGRPRVVRRWLALEVALICLLGDMLYQLLQALAAGPVPGREPRGFGVEYVDFVAVDSFAAQATGWSHRTVGVLGSLLVLAYVVLVVVLITLAWRRSRLLRT